MTETPKNVYRRLLEARALFHKSEMRKTGTNSFANYKYFELKDFLPHALAAFDASGLVAVVKFTDTEATMEVVNVDQPEDRVVFSSPMAEAQLKGCHPVQCLGASQTFLRRYLWATALELIEHDAVDSGPGVEEETEKARPALARGKLRARLGLDTPADDLPAPAVVLAKIEAATTREQLREACDLRNRFPRGSEARSTLGAAVKAKLDKLKAEEAESAEEAAGA